MSCSTTTTAIAERAKMSPLFSVFADRLSRPSMVLRPTCLSSKIQWPPQYPHNTCRYSS